MALKAIHGAGFRCAVCGRVYRHAGMAERCFRTALCRSYNMPPQEKRDIWKLAGGLGHIAVFYAYPVIDQHPDSKERGLAQDILTKADALFDYLHEKYPVSERVLRGMHADLMGVTSRMWTPGTPVHMCYLGEIVTDVAHIAVGEAEDRGYGEALLALMRDVSTAVDTLYESFDPDNEDLGLTDRVLASISILAPAVTGHKPAPRVPSLYVVDGWQLVVAHGRGEVRRALASLGKRPRSIEGIAPGEKFEDGRTAADITALAHETPYFIGEVEA